MVNCRAEIASVVLSFSYVKADGTGDIPASLSSSVVSLSSEALSLSDEMSVFVLWEPGKIVLGSRPGN